MFRMVTSTHRKTGRPKAVYTTRNGDKIVGLFKLADGRWRASGPEKFTFTERDEDLAVARFREWQAKQQGKTIAIPRAAASIHDVEALRKAVAAMERQAERVERGLSTVEQLAPPGAPTPDRTTGTAPIRMELHGDRMEFYDGLTQDAAFWPWLRRLILDKPAYTAERTGIEQIGYLRDIPKPTVSPTLAAVGELYQAQSKVQDHWKTKCKSYWAEFVKAVGVTTLRELTQESLVTYADKVLGAKQSPTYSRQRFGVIKSMLAFPPKRGKWAEDCRRALAFCAVMQPPRKARVDPRPISPADFRKLYDAADTQMRAMLLIGLNACMYAAEVADLKWPDVDLDKGTLCTERGKTGMVRIATLWPATIAALAKLPRNGIIFPTPATKQAHNANTITKAFRKARKLAGLPTVQFASLRDGAYTASVEAGIDLNVCRLLAGHSVGMADHYIRRNPRMAAAACEAIAKAYRIDDLAIVAAANKIAQPK